MYSPLHTRLIEEWTTHGVPLREIRFNISIEYPSHCVQQSSGRLVVGHGRIATLHRVCVVDDQGDILRSYGSARGKKSGHMNRPCHLTIFDRDHVMIVDRGNNKVQLLSSKLTHYSDILIDGNKLKDPCVAHLDKEARRLYIGEWTGGRVLMLTYKQ